MPMRKILILLLAGLFLLPSQAGAQSKGETRQYGKFLKKPTLEAAAKFLKKYPESVYAPEVMQARDSIIRVQNTSLIGKEEALRVAGECLDAVGWRKDNVEHVLALYPGFVLRTLTPAGVEEGFRDIPVYSQSDTPGTCTLVLPMEVVAPLGTRNYVHFAYLNGNSEYVEALYLPEEDVAHQAIFYGTGVKPGEGEAYRIEGQSPEWMEGLTLTPEVAWLAARLRENASLVELSKADLLTDASIRWWLDKNPRAETSASKLVFGALDAESSLVAAYRKAGKEKGKSYNAALFDLRGYTVICVASRKTGEYSLVWCEPAAKNKYRDKFLNSIYFESDGTTLVLFYYKGKKTFKYRISMANQTIRR